MAEYPEPNVSAFNELADGIDEHHVRHIQALSKNTLYIAAGSLALSLTFLSDLVQWSSVHGVWLLILSWGSLTGSIISTLFGFRHVTRPEWLYQAYDIAKQFSGMPPYDSNGGDEERARQRHEKAGMHIEKYNAVAFGLLIFGLVSMVAFAGWNILGRFVWNAA